MAIKTEEESTSVEPSRVEQRKSFVVSGLVERYANGKVEGIPAQWQRFAPSIGKIPGQVGWTTYGVCFNMDGTGNLDYLCGVEIADESLATVPADLAKLRVGDEQYVVFEHREHISKIKSTWHAIYTQWAPASGYEIKDAAQFEAYGEDFNPQTGTGLVEIWIPVRSVASVPERVDAE